MRRDDLRCSYAASFQDDWIFMLMRRWTDETENAGLPKAFSRGSQPFRLWSSTKQATKGNDRATFSSRELKFELNSHSAAQQNRTVATFHLSDGTINLLKMQLAERSQRLPKPNLRRIFKLAVDFPETDQIMAVHSRTYLLNCPLFSCFLTHYSAGKQAKQRHHVIGATQVL